MKNLILIITTIALWACDNSSTGVDLVGDTTEHGTIAVSSSSEEITSSSSDEVIEQSSSSELITPSSETASSGAVFGENFMVGDAICEWDVDHGVYLTQPIDMDSVTKTERDIRIAAKFWGGIGHYKDTATGYLFLSQISDDTTMVKIRGFEESITNWFSLENNTSVTLRFLNSLTTEPWAVGSSYAYIMAYEYDRYVYPGIARFVCEIN